MTKNFPRASHSFKSTLQVSEHLVISSIVTNDKTRSTNASGKANKLMIASLKFFLLVNICPVTGLVGVGTDVITGFEFGRPPAALSGLGSRIFEMKFGKIKEK